MRAVLAQWSPYTACMLRTGIALTMAFALAGCGMKGNLYLPPETPAASATVSTPADADQAEPEQAEADKSEMGERKTIPATPDPSLSR